MENCPMIRTKRLQIRLASDSEMRELIDRTDDPDLRLAYTEMFTLAKEHPDQRAWYGIWKILLSDTETEIGDLCFKGLVDGTTEIGYGIDPAFQRNGYATEAVTAMTHWALSQTDVKRIEAETDPENRASQRVLEKAGFLPTGTMGEEGPRFFFPG